MIDDKQIAELDQSFSLMGETFPPLVRRMYEGFVKEGFTEDQAFDLAKLYLLSLSPNGVVFRTGK